MDIFFREEHYELTYSTFENGEKIQRTIMCRILERKQGYIIVFNPITQEKLAIDLPLNSRIDYDG